jgi:hypothetical protein
MLIHQSTYSNGSTLQKVHLQVFENMREIKFRERGTEKVLSRIEMALHQEEKAQKTKGRKNYGRRW